MESTHSQTSGSQEQSIDCVDWAEIEQILGRVIKEEIPPDAITAQKLVDKYGFSHTTARTKMRKLESVGYVAKFAKHKSGKIKYLVREG